MKTLRVFPAKGLAFGCAAAVPMPRAIRGSAAAPPTNARLVMLRAGLLESDAIVASLVSVFTVVLQSATTHDPSTALPSFCIVNVSSRLTDESSEDYARFVTHSECRPTHHTEADAVHDLVIDNARIIDGLGNPTREGGVAVAGGRIAAVGKDLGQARERVDARGLVLAPGIVDIHTHYDAQLTWDPFATPSTALGVTTVVIGNCGFTIAPCRPVDRDVVMRNLTHVEGMSLEAMRAGISWDFESYPEYLHSLERRGVVPNVASFVA